MKMLPNSNREETEQEKINRTLNILYEFQKSSEAHNLTWKKNLINMGYSEEDIAQESRKIIEQIEAGTFPEDKIHSLEIIPTHRLPELPTVEPHSN